MKKKITDVAILDSNDSIQESIKKISDLSKFVRCPGIAIILKNRTLLGIITDGDIRRAYSKKLDFNLPITKIMNNNPIVLDYKTKIEDIVTYTRSAVQKSKRHINDYVRYIILVDKNKKYVKILDYLNLITSNQSNLRSVAVIGLGYVGLTLAVALSSKGHNVTGVDTNEDIIKFLKKGKTRIIEPGLSNILKSNIKSKKLNFVNQIDKKSYDVYIICIGTSLENKKPNIKNINQLCKIISKKLKRGDQVMIRSTVPVGATRNKFSVVLEKNTNLKVGVDFNISFVPERTIEGNALEELRSLPQVVGGLTSLCLSKSLNFWSTITNKIIQAESLEAAELIKLANNTFRDLSFNFANELSLISSKHNINAYKLISSANDGYPRNKIPMPSPGVGGYCLTKDPLIYSYDLEKKRIQNTLGFYGRKVNEETINYIIDIVLSYLRKIKKNINQANILIIGMAFKGEPENQDLRDSVSVNLANKLNKKVKNIFCWDAIIKNKNKDLKNLNLIKDKEFLKISKKANVILILNNNKKNVSLNLNLETKTKKLIFDGWNQLDQLQIEKNENITYATMGYVSKK